jgi:hypothetical protein
METGKGGKMAVSKEELQALQHEPLGEDDLASIGMEETKIDRILRSRAKFSGFTQGSVDISYNLSKRAEAELVRRYEAKGWKANVRRGERDGYWIEFR